MQLRRLYFIELSQPVAQKVVRSPRPPLRQLYLQAVALTVLGCAGLLLPPRPLFTWFPSLTVLSTSVFAISALLSLDKSIRQRSRSPLFVYIVARSAIILMMCISVCLLLVGFHSGHTTLQITIPLLVLCIVHAAWGCFMVIECFLFRRTLPLKRDCSALLKAEKCEQVEQLNVISCGLDRLQAKHKYLSGSMQTVLTTASDL
uniref:Uncharacterized protein n=1 Tax=Ascaris lumbricoides TaxID=6252 RepID=A0A9J2P0G3_ASCLU